MGQLKNGVWKSEYSGEQIDDLLKTKRNWIRNGYFVGAGTAGDFPINQRGYGSYSSAGLTIDGWTLTGAQALTINATDGGIKLAHSNDGDGLQQVIANGEKLAGKDITVSFICVSNFYVDFSSVSLFVNNVRYAQLATGSYVRYGEPAKIGDAHLVVSVPADTTQLAVGIDYGQLLAIKIEEGTASTISKDVPDYNEELTKCQRYYTKLHFPANGAIGLGTGKAAWDAGIVSIGTPVAMDADWVSVNISGTILASGPGSFTFAANPSGHLCGSIVNLQFTGAAVDGSFYAYAGAGGVDIEITSNKA